MGVCLISGHADPSRGATRPRCEAMPSFSQNEGTARQATQPVLMCTSPCGDVAPPSAPSGVLLRRTVRAHRGTGFLVPQIGETRRAVPLLAASSSRSGLSARRSESGAARARGLLATPAGAGPIHTSRRNRFASLMGNGQDKVYSPIGILSRDFGGKVCGCATPTQGSSWPGLTVSVPKFTPS
jgi:hypothetical protein